MKKTLKFAWLLLISLPFVAFTSCSNEDEPENVLFENYSVLIGKSRQETLDYMKIAPYSTNEIAQTFLIDNGEVYMVGAYYDNQDDEILDKVCRVGVMLDESLKANDIINYLGTLYDYQKIDEDGDYYFTKGKYDVYYTPSSNIVSYYDRNTYFTRSGDDNRLKAKKH